MNTLSRFIPRFTASSSEVEDISASGNDEPELVNVVEPENNEHILPNRTDPDPETPLLGLQRVIRDAQNPRRPVIGSWTMLPGAALARMVAQMGYDFVLVDCEHGNIDDAAMHASVGAIAAEGVSPIVRIPMLENVYVKRALDTGAHGILCPSVSTADEARALVSYSKFPVATKPTPSMQFKTSIPSRSHTNAAPVLSGIRGVGSPFPPAVFRQTLGEYIRTANRNTLVAVQIETVEGLDNCEEIAKVDGIDMLFVGPNDLASSMGYSALSHESIPEVQEAIERILAAAHGAGKYAGMFCTEAAHVRKRFEQGFDLMNLGADIVALMEWNAVQLAKLSDLTGRVDSIAIIDDEHGSNTYCKSIFESKNLGFSLTCYEDIGMYVLSN